MSKRAKIVSADKVRAARRHITRAPLIRGNHLIADPTEKRLEVLLKYFRDLGHTLAMAADPRRLGRELRELQALCDKFRIAFPDYKPKRKAKPKATVRGKTPAKPKAAPKRKAPRRAPRQSMSKPPRRRSSKR